MADLTPTSGYPIDLVGRCAGVRDMIAKIGCGDPDGAVLGGAAEVLAIIGGIGRPHLSGSETTAVFQVRDAVQKGRLPAADPADPVATLRAWIERGDTLHVGYRVALARIWEDAARHAAQRRVSDRHKPAESAEKTRAAVDAAIAARAPAGRAS